MLPSAISRLVYSGLVRLGFVLLFFLSPASCGRDAAPSPTPPVRGEPAGGVHPVLAAHSAEFERRVYPVTDRVHQAVGFGLANSILVEGDDCAFVVDTLGSVEAARSVRAAFTEITSLPIRALVYTHNHADHVFGARAFATDGDIEVYAHESTEHYVNRLVSIVRTAISVRSGRMFGNQLPSDGPDRFVNAGVGPFLEIGREGNRPGWIRPTSTFVDELRTEICGVPVELVHAPGETNDQIYVWLPGERVLMPGDNVYKAFPNLYTIRGTPYRDVMDWVRSLDAMRARRPAHLALGHSRPVSGEAEIQELLTAYRDAIQFVHDQTIRAMNRGLTPDETVEIVKLPAHLRDHPFLQELYGTVEWSVRAIFAGYLGWFDGDAANLSPAPLLERARGMAELAGGVEALLDAAAAALDEGRAAWAAELASHAHRLDPRDARARAARASALRVLGRRSSSPNGRNYYLSQALELEGRAGPADPRVDESVFSVLEAVPIGHFMAAMPVNLDPSKSADVELAAGFRFTDVGEDYGIHVRRGVAEFARALPASPHVVIVTTSAVWKDVVLGRRNTALTLAGDEVELEGSALDLVRFLRLFR